MTASNRVIVGTLFNIIPDSLNSNGRTYTRECLETAIAKYNNEFVDSGKAFGQLFEADTSATVNLEKVSHRIKHLQVEDHAVTVLAELLPTPMGIIADGLLINPPTFTMRALGNVDENKIVSNLQIISIDIGRPKDAS